MLAAVVGESVRFNRPLRRQLDLQPINLARIARVDFFPVAAVTESVRG